MHKCRNKLYICSYYKDFFKADLEFHTSCLILFKLYIYNRYNRCTKIYINWRGYGKKEWLSSISRKWNFKIEILKVFFLNYPSPL
jgi:hypothetical protein